VLWDLESLGALVNCCATWTICSDNVESDRLASKYCDMDTVIRAFQAFGELEAETTIRGLKNQSETHYDNFTTELEAVNKCAPFCW